MMKFGFAFLLTVFFNACGVDTSSSSKEMVMEQLTDSDLIASNPIDPNPVDSTQTDESTGSTDETDETDETVAPTVSGVTDFDTQNAIEDPNGCYPGTYRIIKDASYGGQSEAENGAAGSVAQDQGLVINSDYLSQEYLDTWVTLYYKGFPTSSDLGVQGATTYTMSGVFALSYDLAWADESISGIDNIVYVQSEKTAKPSCYRVTLNSIDPSNIDIQKVYRLSL